MTGRTHDLASIVLLSAVFVSVDIQNLSLITLISSVGSCVVGALTPDIDQSTAKLYRQIPGGSLIGKLIAPILGGHRFLTHSVFGLIFFGVIARLILINIGTVILFQTDYVWFSFMIGFISHLLMDCITREGIPLLFPIPFSFGFPPFKFMRIRTGGLIEKYLVFSGLLIALGLNIAWHRSIFLAFLHRLF